jgi:hypothetical protein
VLNLREVQTTVLLNRRPRASSILLLAALLRVSHCFGFHTYDLNRSSKPHPHHFPLCFQLSSINIPHVFYTFNFTSRLLPPPPGDSFGFNLLFAFPIRSRSTLAAQFARFIFQVSADVRSTSNSIQLWDLTFRVDHKHILGALQFETQNRDKKIQAEADIWTDCLTSIDPVTLNCTFYQVLSGLQISDHVVNAHMQQINRGLRYIQFSISLICIHPNNQVEI